MKDAAKKCIEERVEEIKINDKDDWNIAYGMISLAYQLNLITNEERKKYLRNADNACFKQKKK